jgi:hypothetical protein
MAASEVMSTAAAPLSALAMAIGRYAAASNPPAVAPRASVIRRVFI